MFVTGYLRKCTPKGGQVWDLYSLPKKNYKKRWWTQPPFKYVEIQDFQQILSSTSVPSFNLDIIKALSWAPYAGVYMLLHVQQTSHEPFHDSVRKLVTKKSVHQDLCTDDSLRVCIFSLFLESFQNISTIQHQSNLLIIVIQLHQHVLNLNTQK